MRIRFYVVPQLAQRRPRASPSYRRAIATAPSRYRRRLRTIRKLAAQELQHECTKSYASNGRGFIKLYREWNGKEALGGPVALVHVTY